MPPIAAALSIVTLFPVAKPCNACVICMVDVPSIVLIASTSSVVLITSRTTIAACVVPLVPTIDTSESPMRNLKPIYAVLKYAALVVTFGQ